MEQDNLHSPVAISYAQALLELATEKTDSPGGAEMIGDQLAALRKVVLDEPLAMPLLIDPAIGGDERHKLLDRLLQGRVADLLLSFSTFSARRAASTCSTPSPARTRTARQALGQSGSGHHRRPPPR